MKHSKNKLSIYKRYLNIARRIREESCFKSTILSMIGAVIFSLFLLSVPILILVNLLIFTKLQLFITILLVFLISVWPFLFFFAYYKLLSQYHDKIKKMELKYVYWSESAVSAFILLTFSIAVAIMILGGI